MPASSSSFLARQNFWSEASSVTVVVFAIVISSADEACITDANARTACTDCAATLPGDILRFRRTRTLMRLPHNRCSAIEDFPCNQECLDLDSRVGQGVEKFDVGFDGDGTLRTQLQNVLHGIVHAIQNLLI